MARILAIDYGSKSVGIAISDELQLTARPLTTLRRKRGEYEQLLDEIKNLIELHEVETVVVGLPLNMDGTRGPAAARALRFMADLKRHGLEQPVHPVDERLSSREADRILREQGAGQRRRRQLSDETAAVIILEDYMSRK